MPQRFKLIILIMVLAFAAFAFSIEYARRHPITEAEIHGTN